MEALAPPSHTFLRPSPCLIVTRFFKSLNDATFFFLQFVRSAATVGSIIPSSTRLARAMVRHLPEGPSRRLLEVGAGTGAVTDEIIKQLRDGDTLDVVENNRDFASLLRDKYKHLTSVRIICKSFTRFYSSGDQYDAIVSSLPMTSLPLEVVEGCYEKFKVLLADQSKLVYFEYCWLGKVRELFLYGNAKVDHLKICKIKEDFFQKHGESTERVWRNFPPAQVRACTYKSS